MKPIEFWKSLETDGVKGLEKDQPHQAAWAIASGSSYDYFNKHLFKKSGRSRNPSWKLIIRMSATSEGHVSLDEAIDYFLVQPVKQLATDMQVSSDKSHSSVAVPNRNNVQQLDLVTQ